MAVEAAPEREGKLGSGGGAPKRSLLKRWVNYRKRVMCEVLGGGLEEKKTNDTGRVRHRDYSH